MATSPGSSLPERDNVRPAPRLERRHPDRVAYAGVFVLALLTRLLYLLLERPPFDGDYWALSDSLLRDWSLSLHGIRTTAFEPAYPLFLAMARVAVGHSALLVQVIQCTVAAAGAIFLYRLAASLTGLTARRCDRRRPLRRLSVARPPFTRPDRCGADDHAAHRVRGGVRYVHDGGRRSARGPLARIGGADPHHGAADRRVGGGRVLVERRAAFGGRADGDGAPGDRAVRRPELRVERRDTPDPKRAQPVHLELAVHAEHLPRLRPRYPPGVRVVGPRGR